MPPPAQPARKKGSALESSSSTERPGVRVGRLGKPNGLDGFLGIYVEPEDLSILEPGSNVYVSDQSFKIRSVRRGKKGPQIAFEEVTDRAGAEAIRGREVFAPARRELTDGEFWPDDLVGLEVRPGGGRVVEVITGSAQDRLVVEREGIRFEVPFVGDLVPVVDLDGGFVQVVEIEGLNSPSDRP